MVRMASVATTEELIMKPVFRGAAGDSKSPGIKPGRGILLYNIRCCQRQTSISWSAALALREYGLES
jgi:hypothetical protein